MKLGKTISVAPVKFATGNLKSLEETKQNATKPSFKGLNGNALECMAAYNKASVSFKGAYCGDNQPAKKLFWILTGRNNIYRDDDINNSAWRVQTSTGQKAWSTMTPWDLLKRTPEQAIQAICTLNDTYEIPGMILSPNYGDNWGRRANYLELNPRMIAKAEGNRKSEGLLNSIKLLPAIPPSTKSIPNCVILSQLYPTYGSYNDGYTGGEGLYCMDLHAGISKNLTSPNLTRDGQRMGDDELVKAFNDLAHFRGLKTGVRMPISEGQISVQGRPFSWYYDENAYIDACVDAVNMGFDCIYFDSGKHVGNYQMEHYCGVGTVPDYQKMQYITQQIRARSGRSDISFVCEKGDTDSRYENLGYTAGTDWGLADFRENLMHEYDKQAWNSNYAAGPCVSDDNDNGSMSYDRRLGRFKNTLHSFRDPNKKLPVFYQMHDMFPLKEGVDTHDAMMHSYNRSAYGDLESHYNNIFCQNGAAREHTMNVYKEFESIMDC